MLINRYQGLIGTLVVGLCASSFAFAGNSGPTGTLTQVNDLQERSLLTSLVMLQSQDLTKTDYQTKSYQLVAQYDKTATGAARTDRLLQAMTEMGMATPAQADSARTTITQVVSDQFATHPNMTATQRQQFAVNTTMNELNHSFEGAQFSGCVAMGIGASAVLAGAILGDVYAGTLTQSTTQTSYSGTSGDNGSSTTTSNQNGTTTTTTTTVSNSGEGSSTTTSTTVSQTREQDMLYATSGIMYGVSAAMFIYMMANDSLCN